jgi:hypothetical protein
MSPPRHREFRKSVFINCPFDKNYDSLLRPLLFTIVHLGFNPRIALETSDSGESRIDKICKLIKGCKYSVHDLSRLRAQKKGEFSRLNMPFELGVDYGSRRFASARFRKKRYLILEEQAYNYKRALSDISGLDIKHHGNNPIKIVQAVRNWFVENVGLQGVESPTVIWYRFNDFAAAFDAKRRADGFSKDDLNMMPIREYLRFMKNWIRANS